MRSPLRTMPDSQIGRLARSEQFRSPDLPRPVRPLMPMIVQVNSSPSASEGGHMDLARGLYEEAVGIYSAVSRRDEDRVRRHLQELS